MNSVRCEFIKQDLGNNEVSIWLLQYAAGVACLALSEVGYGAWMGASLAAWWREAPQAELARRGMDLLHDLKPALLAVERYRDVARPLYDMIEVSHERRLTPISTLALSLRLARSRLFCVAGGGT